MPNQTVLQPVFVFVCALAIIIALLSVVYYLYVHKPPPPTRVLTRFNFVFIFFALATIMSLLFATQGELKSNLALFSFAVAGPYAAFLGGLFLYLWKFDHDQRNGSQDDPDALRQVMRVVKESENRLGWLSYESWKNELHGFTEIKGREEDHVLRNFLESAWSPGTRIDVDDTEITTVFIYLNNSVVKFQRIRGKPRGQVKIRFRSNSSYGARGLESLILMADDPKVIAVKRVHTHNDQAGPLAEGYALIPFGIVDCLIATLYPEYPKSEDYLLVDVSRFSAKNESSMLFGIASTDDAHRPHPPELWNLRRSLAFIDGEVPLSFRRFDSPNKPTLEKVKIGLDGWLQAMDSYLEKNPTGPGSDVLNTILQEIWKSVGSPGGKAPTFVAAFEAVISKQGFEFEGSRVRDTALLIFRWA